MGRHASPAASAPRDAQDAEGSSPEGLVSRLLSRLTLAVAAAVATTLAVAWSGNPWSTAGLAGGVVAVVVLGAAWLASTVPAPAAPPEDPVHGSVHPPESSGHPPQAPGQPPQPTRPTRSDPGAGPDPVQ